MGGLYLKRTLQSRLVSLIDYHDQYLQYMESVIRADDDDDDDEGGDNDDDKGDEDGDQNLEHLKSVLKAGRWWHKT